MRLFLSGGGNKAFELEKRFIKEIDVTKHMLYIPIAMYENEHSYTDCYKWILNFYLPLQFNDIILTQNLNKIHPDDVPHLGSMHIGGGNTFKLLKELKETGFDRLIEMFLEADIPIIGGSAGAIIFGKDIKTAIGMDQNKVKITEFNSLDKLKGYDIWPHYTRNQDKRIISHMKRHKIHKLIALQENAGIFVDDKKIEVIGKSSFVFIEDEKLEFKPEEFII